MRRLFALARPTLVRRVIAALLLAFGLVWLVQLGRIYLEASDQGPIDAGLRGRGNSLLAAITPLDDRGQAIAALRTASMMINDGRRRSATPGAFLVQLSDARGAVLFRSPEAGATTLAGVASQFSDGPGLRIYRADSARWSVAVAEPVFRPAWLVQTINRQMAPYVLMSFALVLIPIWLAVATGLRPLQALSRRIAARGPDDLAPLGVTTPYAELQPVTESLDHLLAQLRAKVAREHAFVQDAAHELRTPLAVIAAHTHVLAGAAEPAQRALAAQQMEHALQRASHLVAQLLDLARFDSTQPAALEDVDVADLARRELALLAPRALARGIALSLDAPDQLPWRVAAPVLETVLQNLIGNAIAYAGQNGQVQVALATHGDSLMLAVADDGPGIPASQHGAVFERFHRVAGNTSSGAGLGLAIVRQAVTGAGGSITLRDGPGGKGCLFSVSFPA